ncbi:acyl carrier protein [Umezawaea sp. Da 62-37]|uniref:acyl carrier protein n=1 Tax=Umezawaea sp. Da 62-37 TaxID=3075927 RepID=UPI0028F6C13E|nr:acyl carrier protein [Umezawaea sp. Da 62-37]WNV88093.1 acyl carrier protein [Umezawaea sp. Da 62-37]
MPTLENEIRDFILTTVTKDMNHPIDDAEVGVASPLGSGGIDLDSLSLIELTMRLERRFNVQFPETDIEPLGAMTLGELAADVAGRGATA